MAPSIPLLGHQRCRVGLRIVLQVHRLGGLALAPTGPFHHLNMPQERRGRSPAFQPYLPSRFSSPVSSQFCASCSGASSALRAVLTALCFWTVLLMMLRCGSPQRLTLTHLLSGTGEQPMMLRSAASAMYLRFLGLFLRTLSSVSPRLSGPFSPADFSAALSRLWAGAF